MHAFLLSLGAAATVLGVCRSQQLPSAPALDPDAPALRAESGRVYLDRPGDEHVWARGDDWKAAFGADGFAFVPFLGSTAPRNFPLQLTLLAVQAGATTAPLTPATVTATARRVDIDHGSVCERYELTPGHVEQQFVVPEQLAPGALAIRMAVGTELAATTSDDGSFCFANAFGGVRYGRATAIDAAGAATPVASAISDGVLTLTVPADFVAHAAFPLTIDPVILTVGLVQPPQATALLNPDVAYAGTFAGLFTTVIEEAFSATDHDVRIRAFRGDGSVAIDDYIDFSSSSWQTPRIASHFVASQFLCVARRVGTGIGARLLSFSSPLGQPQLALGPQFVAHASSTALDPDVGGDASTIATLPGNYCVAWEDSGLIQWTLVRSDGLVVTPAGNTANGLLLAGSHPALSKSCGPEAPIAQEWILVWEQFGGVGNQDIWGRRISGTGVYNSARFAIDNSPLSETRPQVSSKTDFVSGSDRWMVVWQRSYPQSPVLVPHDDVIGAIYSDSTSLTGEVNLSTLFAMPTGFASFPCVDTDGTRFAVGFAQYDSIFQPDLKPYLATVHLVGTTQIGVTSYPEMLNAHVAADDHLQITAEHSGGTFSSRYVAVWDVTSQTPFLQESLGAYYRGHLNVSTWFNNALPGCGGMQLVPSGRPALGETFTLDLVNVQGFPFMLLGVSAPPLPLCTGCDLGIDPATMAVLPIASYVLTVPPDTGLIGQLFAGQGLDVFAPGGCPSTVLGFDFTLSNEIIVTIL